MKDLNVVLVGPPSSGKGTQAQRIAGNFKIVHISTGDIFREELRRLTPLGMQAKMYMDQGKLVPDEVVCAIVQHRLGNEDCRTGFLLDGFPRTLTQATRLDGFLEMESRAGICGVLNIEVPEDEILRRMEGRRVCSKCGQVFNIAFQKPQREGICDLCGGELYQRDDDKPDVVRERLNVYSQEVGMLIGYYAQKGCLRRIDGRGTPDQVYQRIETALLEISR